ncbi:hypothetical protein GBA52_008197 [Prunus armeniaca]|nr:hypothetical protein GBA52_008197 [Prunus armeniaca]
MKRGVENAWKTKTARLERLVTWTERPVDFFQSLQRPVAKCSATGHFYADSSTTGRLNLAIDRLLFRFLQALYP